MLRIWRSVRTFFLLGIGIGAGVALSQCRENSPPADWFPLEFAKREDGAYQVGYAPRAMSQVGTLNAQPPDVVRARGRAKFVSSGEKGASDQYPLGYEVEVELASLKKMGPLPAGMTNVGCSIGLSFSLRDRDGFELMHINTQDAHYGLAGDTLSFKGTTTNLVSLANAKAVYKIECDLGYESVDNGEPKEVDWEQLANEKPTPVQ
jgi:hypothetical protein